MCIVKHWLWAGSHELLCPCFDLKICLKHGVRAGFSMICSSLSVPSLVFSGFWDILLLLFVGVLFVCFAFGVFLWFLFCLFCLIGSPDLGLFTVIWHLLQKSYKAFSTIQILPFFLLIFFSYLSLSSRNCLYQFL